MPQQRSSHALDELLAPSPFAIPPRSASFPTTGARRRELLRQFRDTDQASVTTAAAPRSVSLEAGLAAVALDDDDKENRKPAIRRTASRAFLPEEQENPAPLANAHRKPRLPLQSIRLTDQENANARSRPSSSSSKPRPLAPLKSSGKQAQAQHSSYKDDVLGSRPLHRTSSRLSTALSLYADEAKPMTELISTKGLAPLKQETGHGTLQILDDGRLYVDLRSEKVLEVLLFSSDGQTIETYTAKQVKDGIPMPGQKPVRVFSRETLPPGLHKVYRHAARFVAMLRSKTSQLSFVNDSGSTCTVMLNEPFPDIVLISRDKLRRALLSRNNDGAPEITLTVTSAPSVSMKLQDDGRVGRDTLVWGDLTGAEKEVVEELEELTQTGGMVARLLATLHEQEDTEAPRKQPRTSTPPLRRQAGDFGISDFVPTLGWISRRDEAISNELSVLFLDGVRLDLERDKKEIVVSDRDGSKSRYASSDSKRSRDVESRLAILREYGLHRS